MKKNETKSIFERILSVFAWLSFFLAVIMAFISLLASLSGKDNGKEIFGRKMLIVESDSMSKSQISENEEIFFETGDLIIIKIIDDAATLKEGDVISFISQSPESLGKTVTHKIREIQRSADGKITGFVTYGINKGKNDTSPVKPENLIGKYSAKVEDVGNIFLFFKTPQGYYLSILIPAVLLIIFFSVTIGKVIGKEELAKSYTEEIEALKQRLNALEEKASLAKEAEEEITEREEEKTECEEIAQFNNIPRGKKLSFTAKLLSLNENIQASFNAVHNELVSFKKVHSRLSVKGMSYRFGKTLLAKMTVNGKTLKLHLNLDLEAFNENVYHQKDLSLVKAYSEVPFTVKIKSSRGKANALKLTEALAEKFGLIKNSRFIPEDIIKRLSGEAESEEKDSIITEELINEEPVSEIRENALFNGAYASRKKKLSFTEKLSSVDSLQNYFDTVHSELISFRGVKSRISFRCISYKFEKKLLAKMTVIGKTLKLHLALDTQDFNENVYHQKDLSGLKAYENVPFTVKIKSERGLSNALKLTRALAEKYDLAKDQKNKKEETKI